MSGEKEVVCVWREGSSLCLERGKQPIFGDRKQPVFGEREVACVWREGSSLCMEGGKKPVFVDRGITCAWRGE